LNLPVALFSRVPFRDSFLGVKCRYKGGDLFKKCLGVPKKRLLFQETPFSRVKGAKYSVILVLFPEVIHSSAVILSISVIHLLIMILLAYLIHAFGMILSTGVIHS